MRSILLFLFSFLLLSCTLTAQKRTEAYANVSYDNYYITKSKKQRNAARGMAIAGGAIAVAGGFIWFISPVAGLSETGDVKGAERTGKTMTFVGSGIAATSIPLFVASRKNRNKATLYAGSTGLLLPTDNKTLLGMGIKIIL